MWSMRGAASADMPRHAALAAPKIIRLNFFFVFVLAFTNRRCRCVGLAMAVVSWLDPCPSPKRKNDRDVPFCDSVLFYGSINAEMPIQPPRARLQSAFLDRPPRRP